MEQKNSNKSGFTDNKAENSQHVTGVEPGSLIYTGEKQVDEIKVHHMVYDEDDLEEYTLDNLSEVSYKRTNNKNMVHWCDIRGLHDIKLIQNVGEEFDVHPLVLEDILDIHQRPKFEEYANGIFVALAFIEFNDSTNKIETEAIKLYFGDKFVLSFQEKGDDLFDTVRTRLRQALSRIRKREDDYLSYALIDLVVDGYFRVVEILHDKLDALEDRIISEDLTDVKQEIHHYKRQVQKLRKIISPLSEAIGKMLKSTSNLIDGQTLDFIRDSHDHAHHVLESAESLRDRLDSLQDLFMSELSHQNNEVVKLLTIITAIFVPLSFMTGLYGMNFQKIPELEVVNGYFYFWAATLLLSGGLLWYFRRKKWL